jgi:3-hydroxyacyl-[acyl-carrier-protein] dehydratase
MLFSVIDRILACEPGRWIQAEKRLRGDERFLSSHFPGAPVMPGVLILEAMVQAGDWLIQLSRREPPGSFCLRALRAVKFVHFVRPAETLVLSIRLIEEKADEAELACQAVVADRITTLARMTLARRDIPAPPPHVVNADEISPFRANRFPAEVRGQPSAEGLVARAGSGGATDATAGCRWLWLDQFVELQSGHSARAVKRVPGLRQNYSLGHLYSEQLTAALVLEGLAQTGGLLAFDAIGFRKSPIMAKIIKGEFCGEAEPGSVLEYSSVLERLDEDVAVVCSSSHCGDRLHAQAQMLFAFLGNASGGLAVDPGVFYTMMCDAKAFDAPPQRRPWAKPEPVLTADAVQAESTE